MIWIFLALLLLLSGLSLPSVLLQEEYVLLGETPAAHHVPHHSHSHRPLMDPQLSLSPLSILPRLSNMSSENLPDL